MSFTLKSSGITEGAKIDKKFTPHGKDVSPDFEWINAPVGTKSFAFIVDDPDAPVGLWTHWAVKNIPVNLTSFEEGSVPGKEVVNSWGIKRYKGPKPPSGTHRYFYKLFALDVNTLNSEDLKGLYTEIEKHKIGQAQIMGTYTH